MKVNDNGTARSENSRVPVKTKTVVPKRKTKFSRLMSKYFRVGRGMDIGFFGIVILLVVIGLIMLYSASYPISYYEGDQGYSYFLRQCIFAVIGTIVMLAASYFDYTKLKTKFLSRTIIGLSYAFLIIVIIYKYAKHLSVSRSIELSVFTFQASEFTKFALIAFFAYYCDKYYAKDMPLVLAGLGIIATTSVLLFMEPHYSAIVIIAMLVFVMLYLGGLRIRWFVVIGLVVASVCAFLYFSGQLGYAMERLDGWGAALTADRTTDIDLYEATRQTRNSMFAIGSGGLTGLGFGQSREKFLFLAEPQNDFVFAIVCEELGFIGAVIILAIFALLVYQGIRISQRARDRFGRLLGIGLTVQIALQVILNVLVITDWMPNTGISLPFFSYGGSSLVMLMAQMGVVLSISRTSNIEK